MWFTSTHLRETTSSSHLPQQRWRDAPVSLCDTCTLAHLLKKCAIVKISFAINLSFWDIQELSLSIPSQTLNPKITATSLVKPLPMDINFNLRLIMESTHICAKSRLDVTLIPVKRSSRLCFASVTPASSLGISFLTQKKQRSYISTLLLTTRKILSIVGVVPSALLKQRRLSKTNRYDLSPI